MRTAWLAVVVAASTLAACQDGSELSNALTGKIDVVRDGGGEERPDVEASPGHPVDVPETNGPVDGPEDRPEPPPPDVAEAGEPSVDRSEDLPPVSPPDAQVPGPSCQCTVESGGELALGDAGLLVPPRTLAADALLTLARSAPADTIPNRASIIGDVYELGPDGSRFVVPVPLTLPLAGSVPDGMVATVAWLDRAAGQWIPVPSMVNGTRITGFVTHFTSFAVLLTDRTCPLREACGGALDGTWEYSSACQPPAIPRPEPCGSGAPIHQRQSYTVTGTLTINGGQYMMSRVTRVMGTLFYTPECLAAINQSQVVHADCAAVQAAIREARNSTSWNCAGTLEKGCSCYFNNAMPVRVESGAITAAGNKLRLTRDGVTEPGPELDYCIRDDHLSIKNMDGSVHSARKMH